MPGKLATIQTPFFTRQVFDEIWQNVGGLWLRSLLSGQIKIQELRRSIKRITALFMVPVQTPPRCITTCLCQTCRMDLHLLVSVQFFVVQLHDRRRLLLLIGGRLLCLFWGVRRGRKRLFLHEQTCRREFYTCSSV